MQMFPTARRSACDRCREQKLRCPPRREPTHPCDRCTRAGQRCVTGFTKPLGRSIRTAAGVNKTGAEETTSTKTARSASDACLTGELRKRWPGASTFSPLAPARTVPASPGPSRNLSPLSEWTFGATSRGAHDLGTNTPIAGQAIRPDHAWLDRPSGLLQEQNNILPLDGIDGLDLWIQDMPTTLLHATGGTPVNGSYNTASPCDSVNPLNNPSGGPASFERPRTSDASSNPHFEPVDHKMSLGYCDSQLLQLGLEICEQIGKQEKLQRLCSGNDVGPDGAMDQLRDAIGNALTSNARYITILQSYTQSRRTESSRHVIAPKESENLPLQLTCSLNAITTYLRLISLFDKLFLALHDITLSSSRTTPARRLSEPQLLPGLQLAGFSISQGNFQIKILIQAVQHQFETMEGVLGVPPELRLSDRRGAYANGILPDGLNAQLFHSLLSAELGTAMRCEFDRSAEAPRRIAPLASLRRSIDKVSQLASIV